MLEDPAVVAEAVHLSAAVLLGFLFHGFRCTGGASESAAESAHEIPPGLVGQREPFQDRSQAGGDGAPFVECTLALSPRPAQRPAKGRGGRRKGEVHLREGEVPPEPPMGGQLPKTSPLGKILFFANAPCGKWIAFRRQCGSASSNAVNGRNPAQGNVNRFPTGRFDTFECTLAARVEPRPPGTSPSKLGATHPLAPYSGNPPSNLGQPIRNGGDHLEFEVRRHGRSSIVIFTLREYVPPPPRDFFIRPFGNNVRTA